jgi:hypothetical protein
MSEDKLELLHDKLEEFKNTLSEEQKELLDAIVELAREVSEEGTLEDGFEGSFQPEDRMLVLAYADGGNVAIPTMIKYGALLIKTPHHP